MATMFADSARPRNAFGLEVDLVGQRVVVDHDRQPGAGRQGAEMVHGLARVLLVDHAGQSHDAGASRLLGPTRRGDGERRRVLGHARDHRHPTLHGLHGGAQHRFLLVRRERAVLAKCAQHDQAPAAGLQAGARVPLRAGQVQGSVLCELGHQCREHTLPIDVHVGPPKIRPLPVGRDTG